MDTCGRGAWPRLFLCPLPFPVQTAPVQDLVHEADVAKAVRNQFGFLQCWPGIGASAVRAGDRHLQAQNLSS